MTLYLTPKSGDTRQILARILASHTGCTDFRIQTAPGGKPFAVSETYPSPLFFSLSHSGGILALLIHTHPVGVDLQAHTKARTELLARRWFHPSEYAAFQTGGCRDADFFTFWAAKEAYAKYTGMGVARTARRCSVLTASESIYTYACMDGYSLCCCAAVSDTLSLCADPAIVPLSSASPVSIRDAIYK